MKLYITPGSPCARMARIVVIEKGLEKQLEIITAQPAGRARSMEPRNRPAGERALAYRSSAARPSFAATAPPKAT